MQADPAFYANLGLGPGYSLPGARTSLNTEVLQWFGDLTPPLSTYPRPGSTMADVISAQSDLGPDFFENFHTFGMMWSPEDQLLR